jgi:DNA polymerase (family 10)
MKNKEIVELFERMGTLLEVQGENIFKVRAYYRGAENIANLAEDIAVLREEGRLGAIPGVGKALEEKIGEYLDTGRMSAYEKLITQIPETLLEVVRIPSVGPKKAQMFYQQMRIKDVEELRRAALEGRLLGLPGVKEKTVANILKGIQVARQGMERMNLGLAVRIAEDIVAALKSLPEIKQIAVAGSLRRMKETIRDIDILIDSHHPARVMETFIRLPQVKGVNSHGETKSSILTQDNVQVDLRVVEAKSFGAALLYFTGSKNFNVRIRQVAIKKGMKVNEYGIFAAADGRERCLAGETETSCLQALGLPDIPPELREELGLGRIFKDDEVVADLKIPELVTIEDIKGDLHVHSIWSDGRHAIAQMADAARRKGYQYLAISDHSSRLRVAGGVSPADLIKKKKEIDDLNAGFKDFRLLFGTELEIDADGNLDYNEEILRTFDIVVAAIHSGFEQGRDRLTERLIKACRSPYVNILAHPTGVHLGKREPYDIDLREVCQAAVKTNTFLEINAFPVRLDLNSANVFYARDQGGRFVINTDAHAVEHLDHMRLGVAVARRGWLTKKQVLNTRPLNQLLKALVKTV